MIVDTDKTYSRNGIHITPRPSAIQGIIPLGIVAIIIGRGLRWVANATPLAVQGSRLSVAEALTVADCADKARGYGAGRTVWDMSRRFNVGLGNVTWEMLDRVRHYPIVLVRAT
jgi:F420-0:gamma-glutamyl ligase-like protein